MRLRKDTLECSGVVEVFDTNGRIFCGDGIIRLMRSPVNNGTPLFNAHEKIFAISLRIFAFLNYLFVIQTGILAFLNHVFAFSNSYADSIPT